MKSFGRITVSKIYNGTDSMSVDITSNSQVFISYDRGETFTPDVVKLTPNCQGGASFKSWQYSTDNGVTWKDLGNNTHDCTIDNSTHVLSIKHFSDIFSVGNMVSIRVNIVENENIFDIFSIAKIYDGSAMTDGYNSEVVYLYKRSTSVPTIDWTETLNYNFTINRLTSVPSGWSATIPDGSNPLYVTSASAFSREIVDDIPPEEWTTPILYKEQRTIIGIANKYKVSSLSEGVKTSDSGWVDDIPEMTPANKYLWSYKIITYDKEPTQEITDPKVIGIYGGSGSSVTYQIGDSGTEKPEGEWLSNIPEIPTGKYLWTKIIMQQTDGTFAEAYSVSYKGETGSNGLNNATIYLYQRSKSSPAVPSSRVTYNFTNHTATGTDIAANKWRQTIPDGTDPIYVTTATALSTEDTDIIEPSEWATPTILSQNGSSITITSTQIIYQVGTSGTEKPTNASGWTTTIPKTEAGKYLWTKTIVKYSDGTTTESYGVSYTPANGTDGRGVSSTTISYQVSDSGTVKPTTWVTDIPTVPEGKYLWTKTVITYTDNKTSEIYNVSRNATNGADGRGVSKTIAHYLATPASTGVTKDTAGWKETIQKTDSTNKYLWYYQTTVYTDTKTEDTDPIIIGNYGEKGESITIKSTSVTYQVSSSGTEEPTGAWLSYVPDSGAGDYIWTKTTIVYSDSTEINSFSVSYNGVNAKEGYETSVIYLFKRSSTVPTIDWKDTLTYNFITQKLNKEPTGWSQTTPSGTATLYVTTATAFAQTTTDDIASTEWTTPVAYNKVRTNTGIENHYLASSESEGITLSTEGWTTELPEISNSNKFLWMYTKYTFDEAPLTEIQNPRIIAIFGGNGSNVSYQVGTSGTEKPTGTWLNEIPDVPNGKYLWTKIVMMLADGNTTESYSVSYKAEDGVHGINTATVYLYKRSDTNPSKPSKNINYNFETHAATGEEISNGTWYLTIPNGENPVYITTATAANTENTDVILPTEWSTPQILSKNGESGYTILLSNEAHTFVSASKTATTLNAGQSTTTSIKAWKNASSVNVTLSKINDTVVSGNTTVAVDNIGFTVSGNGTSNAIVTIKPTDQAALTGNIKFTITINNTEFEKNFTYTSTCPGTDAYSVKLVSSSQIFKSDDGGVTFAPETITITPIYQNCSHSNWQYSTDGGTTWKNVQGNTDFVIDSSTHTLTIYNTSGVFTKNVTAVSIKCISDKTNVYDTITIARIFDVNDLVVGGRNFLSLITGEVGYCLREYNPIKTSDGTIDTTQCLSISVDSDDGWISIYGKNNNTTDDLNIFYIINRSDIQLESGNYTLSVEWKSFNKYPLFVSTTNEEDRDAGKFILGVDDKKLTFNVEEGTVINYVGITIPAGTVIDEDDTLVFRCQLEQGTVATDWKVDPFDANQQYIQSSSEIESLTQSYNKFQAIFDKNQLNAESNINNTIKNINDIINGTDSTQGMLTKLNNILDDPDNALKNSSHLFEFSTWKTSKDGLEALIGKINNNESAVNELKVKNDGLSSTVTDLTTKGVLACMDFDADHGLTIQTPKKIDQEGGDAQARIVIDGDSVEGFSGNNERQFMIGNNGVDCKSLSVSGAATLKNGINFGYIKVTDFVATVEDANGQKINGLDFTAI